MLLGCALLAALCAVASALASPAAARSLPFTKTETSDFVGDFCGEPDWVSIDVPADAANVKAIGPLVGDKFADFVTEQPVATVTEVSYDPATSTVTWTAVGSDDVCVNPAPYLDEGWETDDIDFRVEYTSSQPVYFQAAKQRQKPRRLVIPLSNGAFAVTGIHWRRWGGLRSVGNGVTRLNGKRHRVRVRLSDIRQCGDRLLYTRLRYRIAGQRLPLPRRGSASFTSGC